MTKKPIRLGFGIYQRADAARLLQMTPSRLRRWVGGYTYWIRSDRQRHLPPVIQTDLPEIDGAIALSFLELMELRVVKAIVDRGVPLQYVRVAALLAGDKFHTAHPFASQRVFTDGHSIFSAVSEEIDAPNVVKWRPGEIDQVVAGPIFEHFLSEIAFDNKTKLAHRWWPLGRTEPVILDPHVNFGAPVVEGTAVRTSVVARLARRLSLEEAAIAYELDRKQARAAVEFEHTLTAA